MKITDYSMLQEAHSNFVSVEKQSLKVKITELDQPNKVQWDKENADVLEMSLIQQPDDEDLYALSEEDQAKIKLLESFISYITGQKFEFSQLTKIHKLKDNHSEKEEGRPRVSQQNPRRLIEISTASERYESESFSFKSQGLVKTQDGRQIELNYSLNLSREHYEKNVTHLKVKDPLMFQFDASQIKASRFDIEIDLDGDGSKETFKAPAAGAGFLALDKNNNGKVDDGGELFGATTGQGFEELSVYDEDGNGWIDENDAIFKSLKIWEVDEDGNSSLVGLLEADVGAIYLGSVEGQYHLKEEATTYGVMKQSSIYLKESGGTGSIHQVDLVV